jgi:hypothetical protein
MDVMLYLINKVEGIYDNNLALCCASKGGHLDLVQELLLRGVDQFIINEAFSYACENGHIDVANELLSRGADGTDIDSFIRACRSGNLELVKVLLIYDLNIIAICKGLSTAYENGHVPIVVHLIENERKKIYKDRLEGTILHRPKNMKIAKLIISISGAYVLKEYYKPKSSRYRIYYFKELCDDFITKNSMWFLHRVLNEQLVSMISKKLYSIDRIKSDLLNVE